MKRGLWLILLCAIAFSSLLVFQLARNKSFADGFEDKKIGAEFRTLVIIALPLVFMGIAFHVSESSGIGIIFTMLLIFALPIVGWVGLAYNACKRQEGRARDQQREFIKRVANDSVIEPVYEGGNCSAIIITLSINAAEVIEKLSDKQSIASLLEEIESRIEGGAVKDLRHNLLPEAFPGEFHKPLNLFVKRILVSQDERPLLDWPSPKKDSPSNATLPGSQLKKEVSEMNISELNSFLDAKLESKKNCSWKKHTDKPGNKKPLPNLFDE
ncbi:MAG: hypothetical protein CVV42_10680 [Candidatus Riflebacteria bacterium HGW-Riflebacteria-2]|nr:MAG: hypothetical protein CVV42_10680 [Candidatus Riflebacteria bacterium HGW-Riflebacteria-2]